MKKLFGLGIFALFLMLSTSTASAASATTTAPGHNKILCFSGTSEGDTYGGDCTLKGNGARGPAILNTTDGDPDGSYAGVYVENSTLYGALLSSVTQLGFSYTGDAATAGSPRISIPIDTDGNGTTDLYAFASAYYCNDGAGNVDVINDSTCTIYVGSESFANWAELVSAHPDWYIAQNYTFIIADDPGTWTITGVKLGR